MPLTDIEKARQLFQEAGLAFPTIPKDLAAGVEGARQAALLHARIEDVPVQPPALRP